MDDTQTSDAPLDDADRCRQCGAELTGGSACWLCGSKVGDGYVPPDKPRHVAKHKAEAGQSYSLTSLLLVMTLISVCLVRLFDFN
jgi:hypothetical protein